MDLRHFEHSFRSQTLQEAIRWLKKNHIRKLPHEFAVGEARVKIKTSAHNLVFSSCSCGRAKCVHLAVVLLHRQGGLEVGTLVASTPLNAFQKGLAKMKRTFAQNKVLSITHQKKLEDKLAWLCLFHEEEKWLDQNMRLIASLKNTAIREADEEVWCAAALQLVKSNLIYSWVTQRLFPVCVQHLQRDYSLEELAERLRSSKQRRHPEVRRFLQEVVIQKRLLLSGKSIHPESGVAAMAWCALQRNGARKRVLAQCKKWVQWPMGGRLDFARFCREQFSEDKEMVKLSLYAELVAAPLISEDIWQQWLKTVSKENWATTLQVFMEDIAHQPVLVRLSKRLYVFANLKMYDELARDMRHPDVTFSMVHEVMTANALRNENVYRGYLLLLNRALMLSSGALKKLIRQKADGLLTNLEVV